MREFTVYAPAKLNLFLDVIDKRPDGYHNIETIFEKIDLRDEVIIRERPVVSGLEINVEPAVCPGGRGNIVYKALTMLLSEANADLGLEIIIKKKIPVAAGLGGGSSDAAAVLRAVNDKFGLGVSRDRLFAIASLTGKDVPFFLLDNTFAAACGTGEDLKAIDVDWDISHIIIKPDAPKSTKEMYSRLDYYSSDFGKGDIEKVTSAIKTRNLVFLQKSYYNIFEKALGYNSGPVSAAKKILRDSGARPGFLSGSGPSVFCVFKDRGEAMKIAKGLPRKQGMEVFVASSCKN
ncbi:MAG: 4-(cytidine 5'-diphospho)-2-C-methyl-D-erythritol kinase [Candidatus Omnitrophica bacterium]|nr:4-(cytidine 5'-diphospho)-2-C-methyl-D-erythritol kinase [Candidatus Omnitrophota bacterium]